MMECCNVTIVASEWFDDEDVKGLEDDVRSTAAPALTTPLISVVVLVFVATVV